jgi:hypothetical protein
MPIREAQPYWSYGEHRRIGSLARSRFIHKLSTANDDTTKNGGSLMSGPSGIPAIHPGSITSKRSHAMNTGFVLRRTLSAACLTVLATAAQAQQPAATSLVEPEAIAALNKMGAYLRTLNYFQVEALTTDEDVMENGLKIQYSGVSNILAHMPDRLRAEVNDDRRQRLYLYDGKTFTLYAQRLNYYATVPAPATIAQLDDKLDENHGIDIPLADLFRWGTPGWTPNDITLATEVGSAVAAGTTCQLYAFRQAGIDWQIWIQRGDHPLPRKIVITTTSDEARPQHTAVFSWNLAPSYNEAAFTFTPPADAGKVALPSSQPTVKAN